MRNICIAKSSVIALKCCAFFVLSLCLSSTLIAQNGTEDTDSLISDAAFREMGVNDFATINGIEKENGFQTSANFSLLDEFKLKRISRLVP